MLTNGLRHSVALLMTSAFLAGCGAEISVGVEGPGSITVEPESLDKTCAVKEGYDHCLAFNNNTTVTITAIPKEGYRVGHWESESCATNTNCERTLSGKNTEKVFFEPAPAEVLVDSAGGALSVVDTAYVNVPTGAVASAQTMHLARIAPDNLTGFLERIPVYLTRGPFCLMQCSLMHRKKHC